MSGGDGEATVIEQWGRVRGRLRTEVGEAAYRSWLKPLTLAGSRNGRLRLAVPTRFMRDWVASNYASRLFALWSEEDPGIDGIEIVVQPPARPTPKPLAGAPLNGGVAETAAETLARDSLMRESQAGAQLNGMAAARADAAVAAAAPALCPAPAMGSHVMGSHVMGSQTMGSHAPGSNPAPLDPRLTFHNFFLRHPTDPPSPP